MGRDTRRSPPESQRARRRSSAGGSGTRTTTRAGRPRSRHGRQGTLRAMPPTPPAARLPETVRRIGRVHHVALIVRSIEDVARACGATRSASSSRRSWTSRDDRVRIAFLGVGESKIELVEPTDDTTGVARFLESKGEGFHHVCFEVPNLAEALLRLEIDGIELIDTAPRRGRRGPGRVPPPALVPRRPRRADRGARRAVLGVARVLSAGQARQPASTPPARTSAAARRRRPAAGASVAVRRPRPGSRPSSRGTGARRASRSAARRRSAR